ncbi:hypothetical protein PVAP13_9KG089300 [Panicum virgatum]|uniref:Uncharacterized protein n=1 Tax=Panicum virgatum TaxID=38727 RepID=A0A8T0NRU8_PANVG|nr:hypothetical protein PVAP13_9KG089300 [Panicum virgatum]
MLHLLQFMAVTSLQEALPIPDLPASLDGLPEALFSSSWPRTPRRCGKLLGPAACFSANHHSLFTCSG